MGRPVLGSSGSGAPHPELRVRGAPDPHQALSCWASWLRFIWQPRVGGWAEGTRNRPWGRLGWRDAGWRAWGHAEPRTELLFPQADVRPQGRGSAGPQRDHSGCLAGHARAPSITLGSLLFPEGARDPSLELGGRSSAERRPSSGPYIVPAPAGDLGAFVEVRSTQLWGLPTPGQSFRSTATESRVLARPPARRWGGHGLRQDHRSPEQIHGRQEH